MRILGTAKCTTSDLRIALCMAFALLLFGIRICSAQAAPAITYHPGGLVLTSGQSASSGAIALQMGDNCVLTLTNGGKILWQSGAAQNSCSSPQLVFGADGNLSVSATVSGRPSTLWTSSTAGSKELVLSQSAPYLAIMNADSSPAWQAVGALILQSIDPPMVGKIGSRGGLYSQAIQTRPVIAIAPADHVDNFQAADGKEVQVFIKAPAPKSNAVYHVPPYPMTSGQKVLDYLANAISYATGSNSGGTIYGLVVFPKATYEVEDFPGCDDGRGSNGNQHWEIAYATDLTIDGQGSTLNFNGLCKGIEIDWSQRVVFRNFNMDWPNVQLAALGTVQNVNANASTMELAIDPGNHVDKNTVIESITAWDRAANYWSLSVPQEDEGVQGYTSYRSGQVFTVPDWANFQNGDTVIARYFAGEAPAMTVDDSQDVTMENVNVYGATGSAFVVSLGRGFRLVNSHVTRLPGSNRLISIAGDAIHMAGDQGDILIEGNTIAYQGDDGLNLNATMWCNSQSAGSNSQPCNPSLAGSSGGQASNLFVDSWWENIWSPGDALGFFNPNFLLSGLGRVSGVVTNPHVTTELEFSNPSPASAQFVADLNYGGARYIIRNNSFQHNRGRGVLLQTSEGLVTGNTFNGQTLHSIYVISSPFWGEGPGAQNVTIANNWVTRPGNYIQIPGSTSSVLGAIVVADEDTSANTIPSSAPLHQNLIFSGNTVEDSPGPGFFLSTANNVVMVGNKLINTNQADTSASIYGTASSDGSIVVTHAYNLFFQGNATSGSSGPVSVDTESTSGIAGLPAPPQ